MSDYSGMIPFDIGNGLKGLVRTPANYDSTKKYPTVFHFCGNGETGDKPGGLALLMNTGFGRQVALNRIAGTVADQILNVIVQSPVSGAIGQPNNFNPVWNYIVANYGVDLTQDSNGQYKYVGMIGLSQGAADVWVIKSWDNTNTYLTTYFGTATVGHNIKTTFIASIPSTFPAANIYATVHDSVFHFTHGSADNGPNNCCPGWPAQNMNTALNGTNGNVSTFDMIPNGLHDNGVWDIAWDPNAVTSKNIYATTKGDWVLAGGTDSGTGGGGTDPGTGGGGTDPVTDPGTDPGAGGGTTKTLLVTIKVYTDGSTESTLA